ncbi:hypothetical protein AX15_004876 [Amanita polypyramis BW_CC]|nr:hypothetical protein AX15_004876 [Amanita polypyramis BW_CC]
MHDPGSPSHTQYPNPTPGASLVLSFRLQGRTTLIIGSGRLAASRAFSALEAESKVIVFASGGLASACEELHWRVRQRQLTLIDWDELQASSSSSSPGGTALERESISFQDYLRRNNDISFVCVTDTVFGSPNRRNRPSASQIYQICRTSGIPVNTTDMPEFCDFTFTSTHRFEHHMSGERTCLQVGVTTNSRGCRLAGKVRRDIVAKLPREIGAAATNVGKLRALAKLSPNRPPSGLLTNDADVEEDDEDGGVATPNTPVPLRSSSETELESAKRRMKWVAQVSEYWPTQKLAVMTELEMRELLSGGAISHTLEPNVVTSQSPYSTHSIDLHPPPRPPKRGRIILVGSGPGHPSLLSVAAQNSLTKLADLVLSDKLVPEAVLALIPQKVELRIAKKFPGNADGAQNELMEMAVDAAKRGLTVVRLKQGDPSVFGRAGEEILYFRSQGFEPLVIPGVSSALAGPTFAGIPVTQRGVSESFVVCTGVGRKGKEIQLPGYKRSRTLIILMGVARLAQVVNALTFEEDSSRSSSGSSSSSSSGGGGGGDSSSNSSSSSSRLREGSAYPLHTPIAVIERASMPDQRTLVSTLKDVVKGMDGIGEQRPPGMMVVGWSVLALGGAGDVTVLDEETGRDGERVKRWLGDVGWRVWEGLAEGWDEV